MGMIRWLAIPALLTAAVQDPAPQDFKARWSAALRKAAECHVRLGKFCESKKQLAWAKTQFERALEVDPEYAEAKRLLAREGVEWTNAAKQEVGKPGPEFNECAAKAHELYKPAGAAFRDAARAAEDEGLKEDATRAWRRTIEFWPDCELARKRLGHEIWKWDFGSGAGEGMHNVPRKAGFYIGEPRWAHTGETAFRKEFEERIKRAPKPERYKCSVEHGAPVSFEFRGTFYVFAAQSETTEQQLCDFGVLVEAVTAWFHESVEFKGRIEDQSPRLPEWPIHVHLGMLLKDLKTDEDRQLMIWFFRGADLALPLNYMINSYLHGKFVSLETPLAWLHLHVLVYLSRTLCGHGIQSLRDVTSGLDPNSPATKEHISYPFWHRMMREQIWLGDDPPIKASIGGAVSTMLWRSRLKGWALIDFLMTDHRKKFNEFLKAVDHKTRDPKDPTGEKTFFKVFEWSPEELEERLRRFVLENY